MTRSIRLRVLMPATYGECCAGTPQTGSLDERMTGKAQCLVFQCRLNLLAVASANVPGRRHNGRAPEWTVSGENPKASAASCALDVANQGPHTCAEIAEIESTPEHKRRVQQEVRAAVFAYKDALIEADVDELEVRRVIESMLRVIEQEKELSR